VRRLLHADFPPQVPDETFVSTLADLAASSTPTAGGRDRGAHVAAKVVAAAASVALLSLGTAHLAGQASDSPVRPTGPTGTVNSENSPPPQTLEPANGETGQGNKRISQAPAPRPTTNANTAVTTPRPTHAKSNRANEEPTTKQPDRGVPPANTPGTATPAPSATDDPEDGTQNSSTLGPESPEPTSAGGNASHRRGEETETGAPTPTHEDDDVLGHKKPVRDKPPVDD
jgi:hypothetical protein